MIKYKKFNMPIEAYNLLKGKKIRIDNEIKLITGKNKKVPMTTLVTTILKRPAWFNNQEIIQLIKKRKGRMVSI
jgi:hypothetical protein